MKTNIMHIKHINQVKYGIIMQEFYYIYIYINIYIIYNHTTQHTIIL
jgi:hypothetical protein